MKNHKTGVEQLVPASLKGFFPGLRLAFFGFAVYGDGLICDLSPMIDMNHLCRRPLTKPGELLADFCRWFDAVLTIRKIQRQSGVVYKAIITQRGIQIKSKTFTRKGDAQIWVKRIEADQEMMEALGSRGAGMRFSQLVDEYMQQWQGRDAVNQSRRAHYWLSTLGHHKLVDISADIIRQQLKEFEAGKALRGDGAGKVKTINRDRSPSTVNRYRTVLSAIFRYAIFEGYVVNNPVSRVAARKANNQINRFLDDGERQRLLTACKNSDWSRLHLLVLMALTSGMRKSEVHNLRWNDIDFENNLARLATSKNGEPRWCPLPDFVMDPGCVKTQDLVK